MNYSSLLKSITKASGWSQERLAQNLGVSFATLNSWINERSQPRKKALFRIERLYLDVVGNTQVSESDLQHAKQLALGLETTTAAIVNNKASLAALTLYLTYHTNTIEGSTMTLADVEKVIFADEVLLNRTAIEQAEARNHQAALNWVLDQLMHKGKNLVIDESFILGIHLRLMNGIISDAGQYRKHSVRIMGSRVVLSNAIKIPDHMSKLVIGMSEPSTDFIGVLAASHARFEQIHPFSDGNGRTGRLILLAQALKAGFVPPLIVNERKYAYYKYLELAQTKQYLELLELFISESMLFTDKLLGPRPTLNKLIGGITSENLHIYNDWGADVGKEIIDA